MLLSSETQALIDKELEGLGEDLLRMLLFHSGSRIGYLEQAYVVGKLIKEVGVKKLRKMSYEEVATLSREKVARTQEDRVQMKAMEDRARTWVASLVERTKKQVRGEVLAANHKWKAELFLRDQAGNLLQKSLWSSLKSSAIGKLFSAVSKAISYILKGVDSLGQTLMAGYYQLGQITNLARDASVYKVPRPTACIYCFNLHMNTDGTFKIYKVRDVIGNDNVGLRAPEWEFVIGPVHPHCYCILYETTEDPPGPREDLKEAYGAAKTFGTNARESVDKAEARLQNAKERLAVAERIENE